MTLEIAQLGQPVLRRKAEEVPTGEILTPEFQRFIDDMLATVAEHRGAGLAGPQVFAPRRIFVAKVLPGAEPDGERGMEVLINPKLTPLSKEGTLAWEGCLSFSELLVLVPRHLHIRVEYLDRQAQLCTLELADWPARIVQHENDHLDGILTVDRAPATRYIIKASEIEAAMEELEKEE